MQNRTQTLNELRAVVEAQMELVILSLYVLSQGPVVYKDEHFACALEDEQMRATVAVAMGAGQSLGTILKNSSETGIGVRDLYPIARAVVEGFINAAFFVNQPVEVAQRALKHCAYAAWKHHHRVHGAGKLLFTIGDDPDPKATIRQRFPEFAGRGQDSWSNLSTPSKIEGIGKVVRVSGGALLGAYGGIYAVSSEIIHGSVYGMSYFMSASRRGDSDVDEFRASTEEQMVNILSAVSHAASGYISAVAKIHKFGPLFLDEHELFKRLVRAPTGDD